MKDSVGIAESPFDRKAVALILGARANRKPIPTLARTFGRFSLEHAYRIQDSLTGHLVGQNGPIRGYKVAFATADAFAQWGIREPVCGRLFDSQILNNDAVVKSDDFMLFHIEPEIAFVVGRAIDVTCTGREQLLPFIQSVHPSFDLADCCYDLETTDQSVEDFVANGGGARYCVLGPPVNPAAVDLDGLTITMTVDGRQVYEGLAKAVLGSPWNVMAWMVRHCLGRGEPLRPGEIVLTGKSAAAWKAVGSKAKGCYIGNFGALGKISCRVVTESA